jgi:hypothetical protein
MSRTRMLVWTNRMGGILTSCAWDGGHSGLASVGGDDRIQATGSNHR